MGKNIEEKKLNILNSLIMNDFATAAERCKMTNFDMIMIHCGHGHVISNFFSPQYNNRTDEYGCDTLKNKCRFANELISMVREKIGDMPIEIRPCIRCCACTGDDPHGCPKPLRCSVNAVSGRNMEFGSLPKAEKPKTVAIVGGGCAGLEAARRLSERGHHPIIIEKDPNIQVLLNTEATKDVIEELKADALIIAVGSKPVACGHSVVIVGAGLTGSETGVALAQEGHIVKQIDMLNIDEIDVKGNASIINVFPLRGMVKFLDFYVRDCIQIVLMQVEFHYF